MSIDPAQILDIVLKHLPEIIQKQPEKARKLLPNYQNTLRQKKRSQQY